MFKLKILILSGVLFVVAQQSMAQDIEQVYQELADKVNEINRYRDHRVLTLDSTEVKGIFKGTVWLTGFFKNDLIRKITFIMEDAKGVRALNYYMDDTELIYITETFDQFTSADKLKTNRTFKGRYFFHENKMFDQEITGQSRYERQQLNAETVLLAEVKRNMELLKNKHSHLN